EGADQELPDGDGAAFSEKWTHAKVGIYALDLRSIQRAIRVSGNRTERDALAEEPPGDRGLCLGGLLQGGGADRAQILRDLIGQHLFQAETKQVRSIAAVGARSYVPSHSRRSARTAVASGTAIGKTSADTADVVDVADSIAVIGALSLSAGKFSLEQLAATTHGAERVPVDDEQGRIRSHQVAPARSDFVGQRLVDPCLGRVRGLVVVNQLRNHRRRRKNSKNYDQSHPEHFVLHEG